MSISNFASKLETYVSNRLPAVKSIAVDDLQRIHGGASRQTYKFGLRYTLYGREIDDRLVLRLDPASSLVETEHANEFHAYRAFYETDVPVPEGLWLEEDPKWLGGPFFVMREILGCETSRGKIVESPFLEVSEKIGEQYSRILGKISKTDLTAVDLADRLETPAPDECWRRELDYWEGMIDQDELEPQPVVRSAIRWLRANPPPPAQKVGVVHGDFRLGNFLYDKQGDIQGILDWEMCHIGDPIEDVTWGMNLVWSFEEQGKVGRMITRQEFIALWEEESGLKTSPEALYWWELFSSVKALAIWIDAARKFADKKNEDIILGHTGIFAPIGQDFIMLNQLSNKP